MDRKREYSKREEETIKRVRSRMMTFETAFFVSVHNRVQAKETRGEI